MSKRLDRNPSNKGQDKPAPQPTRQESRAFYYATRAAVNARRYGMQSPAMEREESDDA